MTDEIMLIRPSYGSVYQYYSKAAVGPRQINPPLGLLMIAATLRERGGYAVRLVDEEVLGPGHAAQLDGTGPRLAGITSTTADIDNAAAAARSLRSRFPSISLVIGGPHASALPERTLCEYPEFDLAVRGEGEDAMLRIADAIMRGKGRLEDVPGIAYRRQDGSITITPPPASLPPLDDLPMAAWDMIDMDSYLYPMGPKGMQRFAMIQTMRGCPNKCIFCYQQFGPQVRFRSPERVVKEIKLLRDRYGVQFINFVDDTFALNPRHLFALLDALQAAGIDLNFKCMTRANTVTPELVQRLKAAGCVRVSMGVESGSQEILDRARKGTTMEQYRNGFRLLSEAGIETRGSFILGLPHESLETIAETIAFSKELELFHAAFNIATPYPGTELWDKAVAGDGYRFLSANLPWSAFRRWGDAVAAPPSLGREEMRELQRYAHAQFFGQEKIVDYYERLKLRLGKPDFSFRPYEDGRALQLELRKSPTPLYSELLGAMERIEHASAR